MPFQSQILKLVLRSVGSIHTIQKLLMKAHLHHLSCTVHIHQQMNLVAAQQLATQEVGSAVLIFHQLALFPGQMTLPCAVHAPLLLCHLFLLSILMMDIVLLMYHLNHLCPMFEYPPLYHQFRHHLFVHLHQCHALPLSSHLLAYRLQSNLHLQAFRCLLQCCPLPQFSRLLECPLLCHHLPSNKPLLSLLVLLWRIHS